MHITGTLKEPQFDADGRMRLVVEVNERRKAMDEVSELMGEKLTIDITKFRKARSLDANAYFWVLCDKIGKVLGVDKNTVYLMQLSKWGVFTDVQVMKYALPTLLEKVRYSEVLDEDDNTAVVRCFYGSSSYDSKEMSDLINGTVEDAKDLGIETITPDEIARLISALREKEGKNVTERDTLKSF